MTAVERDKSSRGTMNEQAKANFDRKVNRVDCQISLAVWRFSDSSEM
jgi:hypothetical protein